MKFCSFILIFLLAAAVQVSAQVGIGTTTPNSMLDVRGSLSTNFRSFGAATTITALDNSVVYTGSASANLTLVSAATCPGRMYWIKNGSTTLPVPVLTVVTVLSENIDGASTWLLDETNEMICIVSNGANWYVLNQDVAVPKTATTGSAWLQGGNNNASTKSLGTIANFDLPFITNNTEKMRLTKTGYLGIGLINPTGKIHLITEGSDAGDNYLFDDYGTSNTQGFYLAKSRGSFASPTDLVNGDHIGFLKFVPRFNGSLGLVSGSSIESFYKGSGTTDLTDLRFYTSTTERMRIDENGRVAIGATTFNALNPEKLLVDAGTTLSWNVISGKGTINNYLQLNIQNRSDGTSASSDIVATNNTGNETSNFIDMGINSSLYNYTAAPILNGPNNAYLYATGKDFVIGNGVASRNLIFFTNGFAAADEKLRILGTGNIGIGVTAPADKLSVAGNVAPSADALYSCGKTALRWSAVYALNGTIQTSDLRLKTNIEPITYGLNEVMQMRPVRYNWKMTPNSDSKIGLIAQEVRKIIPEVVVGDESKENLGMNYAELVPVLVKAIQEQQAEIEQIENNIKALKSR